FMVRSHCLGSAAGEPAASREAPIVNLFGKSHGNWNREVVQRSEGLWVHNAGRWRAGSVRPFLRNTGQGVQDPAGEAEGQLRGKDRAQGKTGRADQAGISRP